MSYKATVLKVMLASPSDVSQERRVARDILHEWNAIHAEDRGIILVPVGWETHSTPEMGERAQAIINKQVLADCDLLVAIFWTRLGSPTGVAPSGTVEEIEEHLTAGKPALIYFSTAPVRLDSVDNDQYSALLSFKESCRSRGLVEDYEDLSAFRDKLARHVAQTVIRLFPHDTVREDDATPPKRKAPSLSEAAQELLFEASKDTSGAIMRIGTLDGTHVQTNNREFVESNNSRFVAKWRSAVDELHNAGLVEDRAGKGELFFITDSGYDAADILGNPSQVQLAKQKANELDEQKVKKGAQLVRWGPVDGMDPGITVTSEDEERFIPWNLLSIEIINHLLPQVEYLNGDYDVVVDDLGHKKKWIVKVNSRSGHEVANIWFGPDPNKLWKYDGLVRIGLPGSPAVVWQTFQRYVDGSYRIT